MPGTDQGSLGDATEGVVAGGAPTGPLRAAVRAAQIARAACLGAAVLLLLAGLGLWWGGAQSARAAAVTPARSAAVSALSPVRVTLDGQQLVVRDAPHGVQLGQVLPLYVDTRASAPVAWYASGDSGAALARAAAGKLVVFGTVAWAVFLIGWRGWPARRELAHLEAAGPGQLVEALVLEVHDVRATVDAAGTSQAAAKGRTPGVVTRGATAFTQGPLVCLTIRPHSDVDDPVDDPVGGPVGDLVVVVRTREAVEPGDLLHVVAAERQRVRAGAHLHALVGSGVAFAAAPSTSATTDRH